RRVEVAADAAVDGQRSGEVRRQQGLGQSLELKPPPLDVDGEPPPLDAAADAQAAAALLLEGESIHHEIAGTEIDGGAPLGPQGPLGEIEAEALQLGAVGEEPALRIELDPAASLLGANARVGAGFRGEAAVGAAFE